MASAGTSAKKRAPYTSKACNSCRRRRCKCDGVQPTCGTCLFYGHECSWSHEEDARRPATKQLVEGLRTRIRELEIENGELRGTVMRSSAEPMSTQLLDGSLLAAKEADDNTLSVTDVEDIYPGKSCLTMQDGSISASGPTSMWSIFPNDGPNLDGVAASPFEMTYQYIFLKDPAIPLERQPRSVQLSEQCQWDRYLPSISSDVGFTRLEHDTLLHRCFSFHTIWLHAFQSEHFLRDMLAELTPPHEEMGPIRPKPGLSYSPFLHSALLSLATALSDNPRVSDKRTRRQFSLHAKQYLEYECERPSLAIVHALIFMSEYHASIGERGLAYLYFGMGSRMARALGLCIDGRPWVASGRITQEELILRDSLFWTVFCKDKVMSLDYGRDYDTPPPHINVTLPPINRTLDGRIWDPRTAPSNEPESSQPNNATLVFFETSKLMLIAIRIMDTVYAQGRQNWQVAERDSVSRIHLLLDGWYDNLPEQLVVTMRRSNAPPLPHIIALNIAYWWLLLLLHRPFYARSPKPSAATLDGTPPVSFADLSVKMCDRAANKIVQLVTLFEKGYSLRYFPLNLLQAIFMAGATLLTQAATLAESATKARNDSHEATRKCIHALETVAQTWECATVSAAYLRRLLQEQTPESAQGGAHIQRSTGPNQFEPLSPTALQKHLPSINIDTSHVPNAFDPNGTLSQRFRDMENQGHGMEFVYENSTQPYQLPYSELHQLYQEPLMGMPSGAEFLMNPHVLPLPFDLVPNEGYEMGEDGSHYPQ